MSTANTKKRGVGRPRVAQEGASITLKVDANHLRQADDIARDMDGVTGGLVPSRGDVLRTAIRRGLEVMRAELDRQLDAQVNRAKEG